MDLQQLTDQVRRACQGEAYAFLPEILAALEQASTMASAGKAEREHLARGIERLVTEDFSFSESRLGGDLLVFTEKFVRGGT